MPFVFEQPNLDKASESHLYFDPGDGRLITVFTNESRKPAMRRASTEVGAVHHVAFSVSQATFRQAVVRLDERGIKHSVSYTHLDVYKRQGKSGDFALSRHGTKFYSYRSTY